MTYLLKTALVLGALYMVILAIAYLGQRRLMYFPDSARTPPASVGLAGVEERLLTAPDGARIVNWWAKAAPGQPTLLYFHGNAGSLATRAERIATYRSRGRGVFMMAYRGYAGSSGQPSEAANVADAVLAYDTLVAAGVSPRDIVVYGKSLGSGVAAQLATLREVAGLILDAPYTSTVEIGAAAYPFLPVRWLMLDRYDTLSIIARVTAPLLIVHGELDTVIPVEMGRRLHAAANAPKEIVTFPRAGHADHHLNGSYAAVEAWIDRLRAGRLAGPSPRQ